MLLRRAGLTASAGLFCSGSAMALFLVTSNPNSTAFLFRIITLIQFSLKFYLHGYRHTFAATGKLSFAYFDYHVNMAALVQGMVRYVTRSQAIARIADRTAKIVWVT